MANSTDKTAPKLLAITPKAGSVKVKANQNVILNFDENIKADKGNIIISDGKDTRTIDITDKSQVKIIGKTLTINSTEDLNTGSHYTVKIAETVIKDVAGNKSSAVAFTFDTVDKQAPVLQVIEPTNNSKVVDVSQNLVLTFDEVVKASTGRIILSNEVESRSISIIDKSQIKFDGNTVTINPKANLQGGTHYSVTIAAAAIKDLAGNKFAGISTNTTFNFDTSDSAADKTAPQLRSTSPTNGNKLVGVDRNITFSFDEKIQLGTGNIVLSDGVNVMKIPVTDSQVSIKTSTLTLNPKLDLDLGKTYTVSLEAGAVKDLAGNAFAGNGNEFTFYTRPATVSTPSKVMPSLPVDSTVDHSHDDHDHSIIIDNSTVTTDHTAHNHGLMLTGKAIDGYLKDATVFADANGDGIWNEGEAKATTDANGNYVLDGAKGVIIASGGIDLSTGEAFKGVLKAPEGSTVVTPLTTLQQGFVEAGQTPAQAQESVAKALGFDSSKVDLQTYDPIAELLKTETTTVDNSFAAQMMASTMQVVNFLVTASQVLQGAAGGNENLSAQNASDSLVKSLVSSIQNNSTGKLDLADSTVLKNVLVESAKESAKNTANGATDFEAKINTMADSVSSVLKDAAKSITTAVEKGGNASNLLSNMAKVSSFTQNDVGSSLSSTAKTFDHKSEEAISALTKQAASLTGDEAKASIEKKVVEAPTIAKPEEEHNHNTTTPTTGGTTLPATEHNHDATPPTTGTGTNSTVDDHTNHTGGIDTGGTGSDEHNHDSGNTGNTTGNTNDTGGDEHNHDATQPVIPVVMISDLSHSSVSIPNTTASMNSSGGHSHGATTTEPTQTSEIPQASFTVMLDHPAPTGGLVVKYQLDGTAQRNSDYSVAAGENVTAITTKTFTIAAGQTSATLNVNVNYNAIKEAETVQLHLLSGTGYQTAPNGISTLAFDDAENYTTGVNPSAVALADFNGDGKLDLAVANPSANNVSVLLRNASNSGFATKIDVMTGTTPVAISTGDFNDDGKTDFAVANLNGGVSVLLRNAGNSGFDKTDISTGSMANAISAGDFNGDGKTDFAVTNGLTNTVSILLQNTANLGFVQTDVTTGLAPEALSVGDFNSDGKLDVVIAGGSQISILLQQEDGSFFAVADYQAGRGASAVTVSDFDGDGKLDVATANMRDNTVSILLNSGKSFASKIDFKVGATPTSLKSADLNGDGKMDLAVLNQAGNVVSVLLRNGENTGFVEKIDYVTQSGNVSQNFEAYPNALTVSDVNGDGKNDIVVANQNGSSVAVLENASGAILTIAPIQVSVMPAAEAMEGDTGNFMIMLDAPAPAGGLKVNFTMNGSATMPADYSLASGTDSMLNDDGSFTIAAGKMNATLNVVTVNDMEFIDDHETVNVNLTAGIGYQVVERQVFAEKVDVTTSFAPWAINTGDFNADGGDDLIIANEESGVISVLLPNETINFSESTASVTAGDFNKDGLADFAFVNTANNSASVILRKTDNSGFDTKTVYQTGINPLQIQTGDFNGDGYMDLVTGNNNGRVSVLLWNATTSGFSAKSDYVVGTSGSISAIQIDDFNGDGKEDLAVANYEAHNVSILLANATGGFDTAARYTTGSSPYLGAGDLDGDGKADLVIANNDSNTISVIMRNAGNTAFETAQNYTVSAKPTAVNIADFNGDGLADLSVVNSGDDTISVLLRSLDNLGFEEKIDFATAGGSVQAISGDFNADSRMDLAVGNGNENSVSMFMNDSTFMSVHDYFIMMSGMMNGGGGMDMGGGTSGGMGGMNMGGGMGGMAM